MQVMSLVDLAGMLQSFNPSHQGGDFTALLADYLLTAFPAAEAKGDINQLLKMTEFQIPELEQEPLLQAAAGEPEEDAAQLLAVAEEVMRLLAAALPVQNQPEASLPDSTPTLAVQEQSQAASELSPEPQQAAFPAVLQDFEPEPAVVRPGGDLLRELTSKLPKAEAKAFFQALFPAFQDEAQPLLYALFTELQKQTDQAGEAPKVALPMGNSEQQVYFLPVAEQAPEFPLQWLQPSDQPAAPIQQAEAEPEGENRTEVSEAPLVFTAKEQGPKAVKLEAPQRPQPKEFQTILLKSTVRVGEKVQELAVKIQPQRLGKVMLQVAVEDDGQVVAKFLTESNQAKELLELNLPQLRESLAKEGLILQRCEVALAWHEQLGHRERREQRQYQRPNRAVQYEEHLTEAVGEGQPAGEVNYLV